MKVFVGQEVFVQVAWSVTGLTSVAKFFIDSCRISQRPIDEDVSIIEGSFDFMFEVL